MRWFFMAWAVVLLLVLVLLPAECCAKGLFSFFNPEVTTPVTAAPSNGSDIIGGMKATITLGSIGSVITSHLALIIFGILLYCAICRLGEGYHTRVMEDRRSRAYYSLVRRRSLYGDREGWRDTLVSLFRPSLKLNSISKYREFVDRLERALERTRDKIGAGAYRDAKEYSKQIDRASDHASPPAMKIELETSGVSAILDEMKGVAYRIEAAHKAAQKKSNQLTGMYAAVCRDNKDPEKAGRIRVSLPQFYGIFDGQCNKNLSPWIGPKAALMRGPNQLIVPRLGMKKQLIPKKDDPVFVEFLNGDINSPVYTLVYTLQDISEHRGEGGRA